MRFSLIIIFLLTSLFLQAQNSLSIEALLNAKNVEEHARGREKFLSRLPVMGIGYQQRIYKNLYVKGLIALRKKFTNLNSQNYREEFTQFILSIDVRYDVLGVILKKEARIKVFPIISSINYIQRVNNDYDYPDKYVYSKFQVGTGFDFSLWKGFGVTSSFYRIFGVKVNSDFTRYELQCGINYTF